MNDTELLNLAFDAYTDLSNMSHDILEIKALLISLFDSDSVEISLPDMSDDVSLYTADESSAVAESTPDYMSLLWCGLVVQIFIFVAVLLNLGVNLWKSFSDKWRV